MRRTLIWWITIEGGQDMPMKNPPHPGEMIGDTLAEAGVSIVAAAKGLGVTRQQLHNLIAGRSGVTPEMAVRLEQALGSTADTWLRMQANYDLAQIRRRATRIKVERLVPDVAPPFSFLADAKPHAQPMGDAAAYDDRDT